MIVYPGSRFSAHSSVFVHLGTQMFVYGTISGDIKDPSWECFIDEINIHRTKPFNFTENNWLLCSYEGLTDGPHNLTVSVTSNGHTFWFDYLQYTPSANVPLEDAVILVDYKDPAIRYYSVWVENNVSMMTTTPGSGAVFNFIGVSEPTTDQTFHSQCLSTYLPSIRRTASMVQPYTDGGLSRTIIGDIFH